LPGIAIKHHSQQAHVFTSTSLSSVLADQGDVDVGAILASIFWPCTDPKERFYEFLGNCRISKTCCSIHRENGRRSPSQWRHGQEKL